MREQFEFYFESSCKLSAKSKTKRFPLRPNYFLYFNTFRFLGISALRAPTEGPFVVVVCCLGAWNRFRFCVIFIFDLGVELRQVHCSIRFAGAWSVVGASHHAMSSSMSSSYRPSLHMCLKCFSAHQSLIHSHNIYVEGLLFSRS